jgi:two-component system, OmpR family, sensor histidine kinase KdpD
MSEVYQRLTPEEALKIASKGPDRGKLKIFIGYAAGVGKTFTMLNEGNRRMKRGEDIVIGYVEPHGRAETDRQIGDLEVIPKKKIEYQGRVFEEMDTEAIITRHPTTILIDELAHTNVPGSKTTKRYEDVREILDAGINVITTLNVQHLESLNDMIKTITGVIVRETIPDSVVAQADELVAVDITIDALLNRLKRGDIYKKDKIDSALRNFFREGNLNALREIALRQTAQEVDEDLAEYMKEHGIEEAWQTVDRIMVCIGASPNSKKLIRRGALIARRYRSEWFVVAVEDTGFFATKSSQKDRQELESSFKLAEQLGAKTVTLSGTDVADELEKFARQQHITQIVIGHSGRTLLQQIFVGSTTSRLIRETKNVAIHVIPVSEIEGTKESFAQRMPGFNFEGGLNDYLSIGLSLLAVTIIGLFLLPFLGYQAVGFLFLLAVLILSMFISFIPMLIFSILSVLIWDFLFIPPRNTFVIARKEDMIMSIVYVLTAVIMGYLTSKIRKDERLLAVRENRFETMYRIVSIIASARDRHQCINHIEKEVDVILDGKCQAIIKNDIVKYEDILRMKIVDDEKELSVAMWVYDKGQQAGWGTDTLSSAKNMYIPLKGPAETVGVLTFGRDNKRPLSQEDMNLLLSTSNQLAVYLERELLRERSVEAQELRDAEKLYQTVLNTVSHEVRTPITTITGITSMLKDENVIGNVASRKELVNELSDSVERLDRVFTNILDMTRLSSGRITLKKEWYGLDEIISSLQNDLSKKFGDHKLTVDISNDLPSLKVDFNLFQQALSNIVLNAVNYTPAGTEITIKASREADNISIIISDTGPGIKEDELPFVFDKFYRAKGSPPGGIGLGLTITKGIIESHEGHIAAYNVKPHGLTVKILLPIENEPEGLEKIINE